MDYGLWNLHGGFWASNNPCSGDSVSRPLYTTVSAGSSGPFHACTDGLSFPTAASSPPCRSSYRSQPEYVAMKPSIAVSGGPSGVSEISGGPSGERTEQVVMSVQNDAVVEHSSVESVNSLHAQSGLSDTSPLTLNPGTTPVSRPEGTSMQHTHKKLKSPKHQKKNFAAIGRSDNFDSMWNRNVKTESTLQYLNQQYNPMYSMMLGRLTNKTLEAASDVSDDDDDEDDEEEDEEEEEEEEEDEEEEDNDNGVGEGDRYSNQSSLANRSPHRICSSGGRSGYECGECGLVADTRPSLKKHIAICHPAPGPDPSLAHALLSKISASCPMASCRFHTSERDELEAHVARHVAEGYSPTGKKRAGPVSLQRVRYEREEYRCQMCAYTCTIEKAFYKHLKLHSLGLNVSSVKISCVICGKDRPTEVDMNKHMRRHRDNRYFCCDICIFRTVQLKKLIQHRRMHTGEKPHLCPHCAYRSARRDNLRSHVRRVHKKENLYCDTFSPRGLILTATATTQQQEQLEPASPNPSQN
ncbi:zinc finger and BTB domain-containing protein 47 isoform X2 [Cryptotermes secundus]|uniref:zinc finger and BTB domain-containing protein 47 isoform X2 n=1 Tax=Cryptotermes secundus TaxID=105785 RepID=UPI000CD7DD5B|nr:zinc finger and BTB domain-containing protein 47 isoform X2 [Cryptotermes secundus]